MKKKSTPKKGMITKSDPLPKAMKHLPNTYKESQKFKVKGSWWTRQGNIILCHNEVNPEGRQCARFSPKYPDDSNLDMSKRLWYNIPDDQPVRRMVNYDSPELKTEDKIAVRVPPLAAAIVGSKAYCTNNPAPVRSIGKMVRITTPFGPPPKIEGTTWKKIRKWAKKCIDLHEKDNKYLTAVGLLYWAGHVALPESKRNKIIGRLKAIYATEIELERKIMRDVFTGPETILDIRDTSTIANPDKPKKVAQERSKDKWGYPEGSRAARINAAITTRPKTLKQIEAESKATSVSPHLSTLKKLGLIDSKKGAKRNTTTYFLKEEKCPPRKTQDRTSAKSAAPASTRSRPASNSAASSSRPKRSTQVPASRKAKPGKSAKRRGRKG